MLRNTVRPVLSEPELSGHPLLSRHLSKSRKSLPSIPVNFTSFKRSLLFSALGRLFESPVHLYILFLPSILNGHLVHGDNQNNITRIVKCKHFNRIVEIQCFPKCRNLPKSIEYKIKYYPLS